MNRAFVSLYLFIVASVIGLGWALNQLWEGLVPEASVSAEVKGLFISLEQSLVGGVPLTHVQAAMAQQGVELQLIPLDELANSAALEQLQAGGIISASDSEQFHYYKLGADGHQVILLSLPPLAGQGELVYRVLLCVFYAGLALAIFLWVWPLSRDARKLEAQTRMLGPDGLPEDLRIAPASTLYPLARAFNQMARRLRDLLASHREMTNAVSHELRTPLARMKFALAMLESQPLDEKSQRQCRNIATDVAEMESLISTLLMYAGFERYSQQLQISTGQMSDLLEELKQRFAHNNQRQLTLELIYTGMDQYCQCEWKLIETALQNAIGNASRYARSRIRIEWQPGTTHNCLAIEDDGPGIPEQERARVFGSFVRLYEGQVAPGENTSGFGLGLAIIQRVLEWHGGHAIFTEPGHLGGARLELHWPRPESTSL
ncbi:ATP-binding protein [Cellvibrio japonicus]|uniref:histidine kinase n=1 Tax=Cellvibrio japonicus (strain Ueda107) TaxID=498211 RepID=B3PFC2_CELJU|nr:ATP-binding protein [Cellvibrio japonicus]ACE86322.1 putative two-component regulatory system, sensor kinase protein [Cellvibrio japonicus Ueda107]QEI10797.1 two-component sensor histidine kinase [Cellvibrio japonicus]QEI14373.1 two-component sensor histidine kinase [Cellvibrio japonicus]QEI17951.1 two-component sensor histidine kinase [Cellvibrio japonicus]